MIRFWESTEIRNFAANLRQYGKICSKGNDCPEWCGYDEPDHADGRL